MKRKLKCMVVYFSFSIYAAQIATFSFVFPGSGLLLLLFFFRRFTHPLFSDEKFCVPLTTGFRHRGNHPRKVRSEGGCRTGKRRHTPWRRPQNTTRVETHVWIDYFGGRGGVGSSGCAVGVVVLRAG